MIYKASEPLRAGWLVVGDYQTEDGVIFVRPLMNGNVTLPPVGLVLKDAGTNEIVELAAEGMVSAELLPSKELTDQQIKHLDELSGRNLGLDSEV